jgi:hypothetical protein
MRRDPLGSSKAEQSGFWNRRCPLKQEIWREFGSKRNLTLAICDATGQSSYLPWSGYSESKNSVYHLRPARQSSVFSSFTFPRLPASHKLRNDKSRSLFSKRCLHPIANDMPLSCWILYRKQLFIKSFLCWLYRICRDKCDLLIAADRNKSLFGA